MSWHKLCIVEAVSRICTFSKGYLAIPEKNVQNKEKPLVEFAFLSMWENSKIISITDEMVDRGCLISRQVNHKVPGNKSFRYILRIKPEDPERGKSRFVQV